MSSILKAEDICKAYKTDSSSLEILRGARMDVREGEILVIIGASGSGKSTLLHILGLLDSPDSGSITYKGRKVSALSARARAGLRNREFGFVFQFYHLLPELNAMENVLLPAMVGHGLLSWIGGKKRLRARAEEIIKSVGLWQRRTHRPRQLSGGEKQRIAIARALMNDPNIVLCDEPTGNLDSKTSAEIEKLLWRLNEESGKTFVIVTHNRELAEKAGRVLIMKDGALSAETA